MKSLVKYAKDAKVAYEGYIGVNGLDNLAKKVYNFIQNIESLNVSDRSFLDKFISDYIVPKRHLADVTYVGDSEESIFASLLRIKPIKLGVPDGRIYEARGNSFDFVLNNNNREPIKVFQKIKRKN